MAPAVVDQHTSAFTSMQSPGGGAWFMGRLERAGADGLRGNWASGRNLHDYEANLLTKNSAGQYLPLGEWFNAGAASLAAGGGLAVGGASARNPAWKRSLRETS
jgi:hypothetical protein